MKKTLFTLAFCAVTGLAGAAVATPISVVDVYSKCMTTDVAPGMTAQCAAFRAKIETAIQDCMRPPGAQSAGAKNAHGYRAQYQICVANVHRQFGKFGH